MAMMEVDVMVFLNMLSCCCVAATDLSRLAAFFPVLSDDVAAQVGRSAVIPFGYSGMDPFQICHYTKNMTAKQFIYIDGKTVIGDGFTVRCNKTKTGGCELVLDSLRHDHAGVYQLIVDGSVVSERCLTVVSGPSCSADRTSNHHEAYYHCRIQHTGPAQPSMDWPELGECSETDMSSTYDNAGVSTRKSSCMAAVPHTNEYTLLHSKSCILSFLDANKLKLQQTFMCSAVMPQTTPYNHQWLNDRMYLRLGDIMYLILFGLFIFIMYCLRNPFMCMLTTLQKQYNGLLSRGINGNRMKQESYRLNSGLQVIDC